MSLKFISFPFSPFACSSVVNARLCVCLQERPTFSLRCALTVTWNGHTGPEPWLVLFPPVVVTAVTSVADGQSDLCKSVVQCANLV